MSRIDNNIKSIAIGSFDGMHIAHQELIKRVDTLCVIERHCGSLTPGFKRSYYTNKIIDFYIFDQIKDLSAREFVEMLKQNYPNLEKIVIGYDFYFGRGREGSANSLKELFSKEVEILPEIKIDNISIHARTIREFLKEGNIKRANRLLGRNYKIDGKVIKGQGLGSKEFVPTINLKIQDYQLPLEGVYTGYTYIDNRRFESVIFLGHRYSTDGTFAIETHILDHQIESIRGRVFIEFIDYIRANRRFDSTQELKEQIFKDIELAYSLFKS